MAGYVLDLILPFQAVEMLGSRLRVAMATAVMLVGAGFIVAAWRARRESRKRIAAQNLPTALTTTGVYANSRNPRLQGWTILWLGVGLMGRSNWAIILLAPAAYLLHAAVLREEQRLSITFGDAWLGYRNHVPRYGLPFASTPTMFVAIALAVALLLAGLVWAAWPRDRTWRIAPNQINVHTPPSYAYVGPLPVLAPLVWIASDSPSDLARSGLRLFENGNPLGPPHSQPPRLESGRGAYLHWNGTLIFTASDNSNPRTNRRVYEVRALVEPDWLVVSVTVALIIAAGVGVLAHMRWRMTRPWAAG